MAILVMSAKPQDQTQQCQCQVRGLRANKARRRPSKADICSQLLFTSQCRPQRYTYVFQRKWPNVFKL